MNANLSAYDTCPIETHPQNPTNFTQYTYSQFREDKSEVTI
jgi:hypothetical protein